MTARRWPRRSPFLHWLTADNFVFLGYREYASPATGRRPDGAGRSRFGTGHPVGRDGLRVPPAEAVSELRAGPARTDAGGPAGGGLEDQPRGDRAPAGEDGLRRRQAGRRRRRVVGELRLLGLFTSKALQRAGARHPAGAPQARVHHGVGGSLPRIARLQGGRRDLRELPQGRAVRRRRGGPAVDRMALLGLEEKRHVQLFVRPDLQAEASRRPWRCPATVCQPSCGCGSRTCSRSASTASRSTTTSRSARPIRPASTSPCMFPRARSLTSRSPSWSGR